MEKSNYYITIIIIGGILFLFGSITLISNLEKKFDPSKSNMTIFGRNDVSNHLNLFAENIQRKRNREAVVPWIIIGGMIILVGLILQSRSNMVETEEINRITKLYCNNCNNDFEVEDIDSKPNNLKCPHCNSKIQKDEIDISDRIHNSLVDVFCENCGNKLEYDPVKTDNDLICHICNTEIETPTEIIENDEENSLLFVNCKECDVSIELDENDLKNGYFICPGCNVKNTLVRIVTTK